MRKITRLAVAFLIMFNSFLRANECPALIEEPDETKTFGEVRVKAIKGWDKLLTWALSPQYVPYVLKSPLQQQVFRVTSSDLVQFDENYGYFSIYHPIAGIVTDSDRDIKVTSCLLQEIHTQIPNRRQLHFTTDEILCKVLAYRSLKKGMKIVVSMSKDRHQTYVVDEVINLWKGMPAFGLVPEKKNGVAPILLFRGTDLNLTSEKGWASVLSDLDTTGPGHTTFLRAQKEIHNWLVKVKEEHEPARVMGFSLGGVFVLYTMIYETEHINKTVPSVAYNPPGVSKEILEKWEVIEEEKRPAHKIYVNQGDFVSQIGFFLSNVWELSLDHPMGVIEAHVTLISAQYPYFKMSAVDVAKVNHSRNKN